MYTFSAEYNAMYGHGIVIRHASVAGGAQREGYNFATVFGYFVRVDGRPIKILAPRSAHGNLKELTSSHNS